MLSLDLLLMYIGYSRLRDASALELGLERKADGMDERATALFGQMAYILCEVRTPRDAASEGHA